MATCHDMTYTSLPGHVEGCHMADMTASHTDETTCSVCLRAVTICEAVGCGSAGGRAPGTSAFTGTAWVPLWPAAAGAAACCAAVSATGAGPAESSDTQIRVLQHSVLLSCRYARAAAGGPAESDDRKVNCRCSELTSGFLMCSVQRRQAAGAEAALIVERC